MKLDTFKVFKHFYHLNMSINEKALLKEAFLLGKTEFIDFLSEQGLRICPSLNRYYRNDRQILREFLAPEEKEEVEHKTFRLYLQKTW